MNSLIADGLWLPIIVGILCAGIIYTAIIKEKDDEDDDEMD